MTNHKDGPEIYQFADVRRKVIACKESANFLMIRRQRLRKGKTEDTFIMKLK